MLGIRCPDRHPLPLIHSPPPPKMHLPRRRPPARAGSFMCRFSDAGGDEPSMRSGGRRLKSAEARNRGEVGHGRCRGLYGDLAAALGWGGWIKAPAPIGLL